MRKMLSAALLMCIVALLTLSTPVHATPPQEVEGKWSYTFPSTVVGILEMWEGPGGNTFLYADEDGRWYDGPFLGISYDVFTVVMHPSGFWNVEGRIYFDGTVMGELGSLVILFVGKKPLGEDWYGQWVIISGEGGLADLRGQGTWKGPGAPAPGVEGDLEYSGWIHFD